MIDIRTLPIKPENRLIAVGRGQFGASFEIVHAVLPMVEVCSDGKYREERNPPDSEKNHYTADDDDERWELEAESRQEMMFFIS